MNLNIFINNLKRYRNIFATVRPKCGYEGLKVGAYFPFLIIFFVQKISSVFNSLFQAKVSRDSIAIRVNPSLYCIEWQTVGKIFVGLSFFSVVSFNDLLTSHSN